MSKKSIEQISKMNLSSVSWSVYLVGIIIAFILGVASTLAYHQTPPVATSEQVVEIVGSDGLLGGSGFSEPFKTIDKIHYTVIYKNNSKEDRFIEIKATGNERNGNEDSRDANGSTIGAVTGMIYSDKALVKAGESGKFYVTVVQTKDNATQYVNLEALKAK